MNRGVDGWTDGRTDSVTDGRVDHLQRLSMNSKGFIVELYPAVTMVRSYKPPS